MRFLQPEHGYRVNVDSLLLARFACVGRTAQLAVDLGAGIGLVALLLAHYEAARELVLVERESELAALARDNLTRASVRHRVCELDVSAPELEQEFARKADLVVSNPPFYTEGEHRAPADQRRVRARLGELGPFLTAAEMLLSGPKARAIFVYPARSLSQLFECAQRVRLVPKRMQLVHAFAERPARLALLELRRARPGGLVVEPPLIEWQATGVPTPALAELMARPADDRR
ncbi:MAG: methyltransferase [Polyangiaceae bacterium]